MTDGAISTHGLTKHYGDVRALVDLDLEVRAGEIFGFLGPNGAGKTTTIRTLMDEIRPTAGSATIVGLDTHDDAVAIRRHVGYLPGDLAMYPNLTGNDTVTYFANLRGGVDRGYVSELADRLPAFLESEGPAMLLVKVEPGNVKGIARVTHTPPEIARRFARAVQA